MLVKQEIAQSYLGHGLVHTAACRFLYRERVILLGLGRIASRHIQIAYGIIYLVLKLLISLIPGHGTQRPHLAPDIGARIYLALLDTGVELRAVIGRTALSGPAESRISSFLISEVRVHLSEQKVKTVFLRTARGGCRLP